MVRWPGPILVATCALALVGLLALPGYKTELRRPQITCPPTSPSNVGYAAAERHFDGSRMNPELLMVQSDHDLRNSADFLVIDKIAKADLSRARDRQGADDHPANGQADRALDDPVPAQHAGHQSDR